MKNKNFIHLPGLNKQLHFLKNRIDLSNLRILILGSGTVPIARQLGKNNNVEIIVEEYESLMSTKLELDKKDNIIVKIMDFERTDYTNNKFDLVYVQGSISDSRRKNIVKEIKRILKPEKYLCIGEIVKLEESIPNFVQDIFDASNMLPLNTKEVIQYYLQRNFELIDDINLSNTLKEYYTTNLDLLKKEMKIISDSEKSYYKKILNKLSHESNAYLKLGADKYYGFKSILLKKISQPQVKTTNG